MHCVASLSVTVRYSQCAKSLPIELSPSFHLRVPRIRSKSKFKYFNNFAFISLNKLLNFNRFAAQITQVAVPILRSCLVTRHQDLLHRDRHLDHLLRGHHQMVRPICREIVASPTQPIRASSAEKNHLQVK